MATTRYSFSLDSLKDAHIIKWLETQPNLSAAVRVAILHEIEKPTMYDLDAKMDRILDTLRNVQVVTGNTGTAGAETPGSEPATAAAGLGAMLGRFKG